MKKVGFCWYAHKSNVGEIVAKLGYEDSSLLSYAIYTMDSHDIPWHVCKYDSNKHTFSLIQCPTWDELYEPIVGDSYLFKEFGGYPKVVKGNKTVYHRKHDFVSDDYKGFDIEESKRRTELLESFLWIRQNKNRIGSKRVWETVLKKYLLPKAMPKI